MSAPAVPPAAVPFSAARGAPATAMPPDACDCHVHVYDGRVPAVPGARLRPPDATLAQYQLLQSLLGLQRVVCVTPSTHGTDNRGVTATLAALGTAARGVAVLDPDVDDAELARLHAAGVRGIRLNLSMGVTSTPAMLRPLARRVAPWGWHVQLIAPPERLLSMAHDLDRLQVDFVLDHFAKLAPSQRGGEVHRRVLHWLAEGRGWIKLSGAYLLPVAEPVAGPVAGPREESRDAGGDLNALARSFLEVAPHRVLWGSNWPHATASAGLHAWPDEAADLDRLARWCGDEATLQRGLVRNPQGLYDFPQRPANPSCM